MNPTKARSNGPLGSRHTCLAGGGRKGHLAGWLTAQRPYKPRKVMAVLDYKLAKMGSFPAIPQRKENPMVGDGFPKTGARFPPWLRKPIPAGYDISTRDILRKLRLNTVCRSAECPNLGECWHNRTATFLICGDVCTRNCAYCAVRKGVPEPLDPDEPRRVAEAAKNMGLRHVVVTSVTRDDLSDGGAGQFAATIRAVREICGTAAGVETLVPDFGGSEDALAAVLAEQPDVFNHNIETVARLFPAVRPQADYLRSLRVLEMARRELAAHGGPGGEIGFGAACRRGPDDKGGMIGGELGAGDGEHEAAVGESARAAREMRSCGLIKSGLMVGMGETPDEVAATLKDLKSAGCDAVTIGQYLSPSPRHMPVAEYMAPERFEEYADLARSLGFVGVASGPFVRSSYRAEAMLATARDSRIRHRR